MGLARGTASWWHFIVYTPESPRSIHVLLFCLVHCDALLLWCLIAYLGGSLCSGYGPALLSSMELFGVCLIYDLWVWKG